MPAFTPEDVAANRRFFADKLRAEKGFSEAVGKVKGTGRGEFLLVDTRGRDAYAKAHIPGALCVPLAEVAALAAKLPRDKELVTYCWNAT